MSEISEFRKYLHYLTMGFYALVIVLPLASVGTQGSKTLKIAAIMVPESVFGLINFIFEISNIGALILLIVNPYFWVRILEILIIPTALLGAWYIYKAFKTQNEYPQEQQELFDRLEDEKLKELPMKGTIKRWFSHEYQKIKVNPLKKGLTFAILSLVGIFGYRDRIIARRYKRFQFEDVITEYAIATLHIGSYLLFLGILVNILLIKTSRNIEPSDLTQAVKDKSKSTLESMKHPLTVQYLTIHILSLIFMMYSYSSTGGNPLNAPNYYLELMITYGLNVDATVPPILSIFSYIFAPIFVLFLGLVLYRLEASGFAPNGPGVDITAPESKFKTETSSFGDYAYFNRDIPGAENYIEALGYKANSFYLLIIFGSIFIGLIISSIINYYLFDDTEKRLSFKLYFTFTAVIAFFVGYVMAVVTAPVVLAPTEIFYSLFVDRLNNRFIIYDNVDTGRYHPLATFWAVFYYWGGLVVLAIVLQYLTKYILSGKIFEKKENEQLVGRKINKSKKSLPFD